MNSREAWEAAAAWMVVLVARADSEASERTAEAARAVEAWRAAEAARAQTAASHGGGR